MIDVFGSVFPSIRFWVAAYMDRVGVIVSHNWVLGFSIFAMCCKIICMLLFSLVWNIGVGD